ncbi:MAG: hypothetical protein ACLQU1_28630 [Bryobacteraceae bacterium]
MDLTRVLAQLRLELENIDVAIASLERLAAQKQRSQAESPAEVKRRGRPPKHASPAPDAGLAIQKRSSVK